VSGWQQHPSAGDPGSRSYWGQAAAPDPLSPGQLIRGAWRLYRSAPGRFLLVAAVPAAIQGVLALPSLLLALAFTRVTFDVLGDYFERAVANPEAYRNADSSLLQEELERQLRTVLVPDPDVLFWSALAGGVALIVGLVGTAALTATALASASARPIPALFAFRLVAARAGLVKPILALGIGYVAVSWFPLLLQNSAEFQTWAGEPGSPRSTLIASILSVLALVVVVAIIVLAIRWALFIPAVLVEALGVGPGLARAAQLSRGIRIRLALATIGVLIIVGIAVGIVAVAVGIAVGLAAGSVELGFGAYVAASLIGGALSAPILPALFALAYRERTKQPNRPTESVDPAG
jgi:hypothetical protein